MLLLAADDFMLCFMFTKILPRIHLGLEMEQTKSSILRTRPVRHISSLQTLNSDLKSNYQSRPKVISEGLLSENTLKSVYKLTRHLKVS